MRFSGKQEISKELENIANAMNDYYNGLAAIENIIKNWDPLKKASISHRSFIIITFL